jgi:hypothetical protein
VGSVAVCENEMLWEMIKSIHMDDGCHQASDAGKKRRVLYIWLARTRAESVALEPQNDKKKKRWALVTLVG